MSYQDRPFDKSIVPVVVCDFCGDFSGLGDRNWRKMRHQVDGKPTHLCPACRPKVVWCACHHAYHLPDGFHRRGCVDCGGLFTSVVREEITRCPSCRRAAGEVPTVRTPQPVERPRSLAQLLFGIGHRR